MIWRQFRHPDLGCCSYAIGCTRNPALAIIDPRRDAVADYLAEAQREGLPIVAVIETHLHSDHYSGALDLAARTGATTYVHPAHSLLSPLSVDGEGMGVRSAAGDAAPPRAWGGEGGGVGGSARIEPLADNQELRVGNRLLRVLHTPGHSKDSLCLIADDRAVFTGDTLLVGDVGRPDLGAKSTTPLSPAPSSPPDPLSRTGRGGTNGGDDVRSLSRLREGEIRDAAHALYASLQRLLALPDWYEVWPGHYGPSVCGAQMSDKSSSTLGYERRKNYALQALDADDFCELILAELPPEPAEMLEIRRQNAGR